MKIAYLGTGAWGYCLASLLAKKGHCVTAWTNDPSLAKHLNETGLHPKLPCNTPVKELTVTTEIEEALRGAEMIVESVTAAGIRPVFSALQKLSLPKIPIVLTSKGIEQNTGLLLSEIIFEILGAESKDRIGAISGPSYASEVIRELPTSVVGSGYNRETINAICEAFTTDYFRVYPNSDMKGVSYGGALKNVIAIACGIAEGLSLGYSTRAALITRGLHEIQKLAVAKGALRQTLYGLSGMGDLVVTCSATTSRNFMFGSLLAEGFTVAEAENKIGMVVEGVYTAVSALQLSKQTGIEMPITEAVNRVLFEGLPLSEAVPMLMKRIIKEEHM